MKKKILLWATLCLVVLASVQAATRPNVLFIAVDDLRADLGCYGNDVVYTPHLDKLADSGVTLTRAYCQVAVCGASRASLMTGTRPDTNGIYMLKPMVREAMPNVLTLTECFKNNGYQTIGVGKIYHDFEDDPQGWCDFEFTLSEQDQTYIQQRVEKNIWPPVLKADDVSDEYYSDGLIAQRAIEHLQAQHNKKQEEPFFLAVGFKKPHLPFNAPKKYWDLYDRAEIKIPARKHPQNTPKIAFTRWGEMRHYQGVPQEGDVSDELARQLIHGYQACVSYVDAQIGKVLTELERLGLRENTIVVVWGDHGWKVGEYGDWCKHTNFELDVRAPLIYSGPGIAKGRKGSGLVEFVDVYPTLVDLCGIKIPEHCEGSSSKKLLQNPSLPWKKAAFSQFTRDWAKAMGNSVRSGKWRYVEWVHDETGEILERELYDHAHTDIAIENLANNPSYKKVVNEMSSILKEGWQNVIPE